MTVDLKQQEEDRNQAQRIAQDVVGMSLQQDDILQRLEAIDTHIIDASRVLIAIQQAMEKLVDFNAQRIPMEQAQADFANFLVNRGNANFPTSGNSEPASRPFEDYRETIDGSGFEVRRGDTWSLATMLEDRQIRDMIAVRRLKR
jgi:hypothetical protein